MLPYFFAPEAEREFDEAFDYYERQLPGLGDRFLDNVTRTVELICRMPTVAACIFLDARRRSLNRFPYVVIYRVVNDTVQVISVFHTSRNPDIWKSRVPASE